jgi:hypothetical protein
MKIVNDKAICVIVCIFGKNFTKLHKAPLNYDSYCFTNNEALKSEADKKGWKYIFMDFPLSEDNAISSFQSKYIKFLQFLKEDKYSYFMKYEAMIYTDHKIKLRDKHVKYLIETIECKKILVSHSNNRKNIWEEVGAAMFQERYLRFMPQTIDYIREKIKEGYSDKPIVIGTGLIMYKHQEKDVIDFVDKVYEDLRSIGTSECQIVWAMLGQKYDDIIKIIIWNDLAIEWKTPLGNESIIKTARNIAKNFIKMFIPYGLLKLWEIVKCNICKNN